MSTKHFIRKILLEMQKTSIKCTIFKAGLRAILAKLIPLIRANIGV